MLVYIMLKRKIESSDIFIPDSKEYCSLESDLIDRTYFAKNIKNICSNLEVSFLNENFEKILINHWKPYMKNLGHITIDATCYETSIRYPTDQKLLWESIEYLYRIFCPTPNKVKFRLVFLQNAC